MSVSTVDSNWSSKSVAVKWTPATMSAARASLASTSSSDLLRLLLSLVHVRKILYAQMSEDIKAILEYCLAPSSTNATKWIRVVAAILKQAGNAGTGLAVERSAAATSTDANLVAALSPADELVDLIVHKLASSTSIDALASAPPRRFLPHESCYLAPEMRPGGSAAASTLLPPLNTSLSDFRTHAKSLNGANVSANNHAAALALQSQFALLNPHCSVRIPISFDVVIPKDETEELHAHAQPMMHVHQPSASPPPVSAAKASAGAAAAFFPSSSSSAARPTGPVPLSRGTSSLFSTRPTTNQPAPTISASAALAAIGGGGGGTGARGPVPIPIPGTAAAAAGGFAKRSAIKMLDAAEANLSISAAGGGAGGHAAKKARPSIGPAVVPMISLPGTSTLQVTSAPLSAKAEREREREAARAAKQKEKEEKEAAKEAAKAEKLREKEAKQKEKEAKEQERADKKLQAILDKQSKEEAKAAKAAAKAAAAAAAAAALTGGSNTAATAAHPPPAPAQQPAVATSFPAPDYAASTPALAVSSLPPSQQQQLALALGGAVPPQLLQALMTPQTPADQQMLAMMAAWGQMQQQQQQQQQANVMYAPNSSMTLPAAQPAFGSYGSISGGAGSYSLPVQATALASAVSTSSASSALAEFPPPPPMDAAAPVAPSAMDTSDHAFPPPPPVAPAAVAPASSAAQLSGLINVGLLHQTPTVSAPVSAASAAFFPPPPPISAPAPTPAPVAAIDPAAVSAVAAAASAAAPAATATAPAPVDVAHILAKSNRVTPAERELITSFLHRLPFDQPFGAINDTYSILLHEEETADGWRETTTFEITSFAQGSWRKVKRRKKAKQHAATTAATVPAAAPPATAVAAPSPAFVAPAADSKMPD